MDRDLNLKCVLKAETQLGEGPVWCSRRQLLFWVDILGQAVHRFDPATGSDSVYPVPAFVGSLALTQGESVVVALHHGLGVLNLANGHTEMILELEPVGSGNRMNDGKCDDRGRFWVGSMNLKEQDATGSLYRVDSGWKSEKMLNQLIISNGMDWSPDRKQMYLADSGTKTIYVFDFDPEEGRIRNQRSLVAASPRGGVPDGLCVDANGFIWCAYWDGGCVARFSPDGIVDRIIELPVPRPTCMTFGGKDLNTLFITTARCGLDQGCFAGDSNLSGSLFAVVDMQVRGQVAQTFPVEEDPMI